MSIRLSLLSLLSCLILTLVGCGDQTPTDTNRGAPGAPYSPTPIDSALDQPVELTLSWVCIDPEDDPVVYDVHFGSTEVPPRILIDHSQRSYTVSGLSYDQTYYWRIVAYDDKSHVTMGPVWRFRTESPPNQSPAAPFSPSPADSSSAVSVDVILQWACADVDGDTLAYDVYFGYTPYPPQVSHHQTETSFDPPDLMTNRAYYWRIVAFDNQGHLAEGPIWMFTTGGPGNEPPALPSNPVPADSSIERPIDVDLNWTCFDPDDESLTYDVFFGGSVYPPEISRHQPEDAYDPGVLTLNKTYYWKIIAHDPAGHSTEGPLWRFTTTTLGNHPPESPSNPQPQDGVAFQPVELELSWDCSDPYGDPIRYDIYFSGSPELVLVSEGAEVNTYNPGELLHGRTYFWRIIAHDSRGAPTEGLIWRFITTEESGIPAPPAGPSSLRAEAVAPDRINLIWQDNSVIEEGYLIECKDGDAGVWAQIAELPANSVRFTDAAVEAESVFLYRARAFNASGPSVYSNTARAVTPEWPLLPPQDLTAEAVSSSAIRLSWRDSTHHEEGISIERKVQDGIWMEAARLAPDVVFFEDGSLAINTTYFYRARMWIAEDFSEYSTEAAATTFPVPPAAPSNLTAQREPGGAITLVWQDNSNNETDFAVQRRINEGVWSELDTVSANVTRLVDDTTEPYTSYHYRVRAHNRGGHSDFSNEAAAATLYVGRIVVVATGAEGVQIVALNGSNQASAAGSLRLGDEARGVAMLGNRALVAANSAGLAVVDVEDPFHPQQVGGLNIGDEAQNLTVHGDYTYICARGSLVIVNTSDPLNPSVTGRVNLPDWGRDIVLDSENFIAYVAADVEGLVAVDVSTPSQPAIIGQLEMETRARGVALASNCILVAADTGGLLTVDVSQPENPTIRGSDTAPDGSARDVVAENGMAFVAYGSTGLQVFNINDLDHPYHTGDFAGPSNAAGIAIGFSTLFLANQRQPGLYVIDHSTPTDPDLIDSLDLTGGGAVNVVVMELTD